MSSGILKINIYIRKKRCPFFTTFFSIYTFFGKDFTPAVINEVQKDSPAMVGGLKQNDIILEIDGNKVQSIMDVSKYITMSTDEIIDFSDLI